MVPPPPQLCRACVAILFQLPPFIVESHMLPRRSTCWLPCTPSLAVLRLGFERRTQFDTHQAKAVPLRPLSAIGQHSPSPRATASGTPNWLLSSALTKVLSPGIVETVSLPTQLLDDPSNGQHHDHIGEATGGSGNPPQRGSRKPGRWSRRLSPFYRQWSLDLLRKRKGPATPAFPDGAPFTLIRKFKWAAGRAYRVNTGRRFKLYMSLKRGSRKGAK